MSHKVNTKKEEQEKMNHKHKKDPHKDKGLQDQIKKLKDELEKKHKEAEENKNIAQRIKAEFDNYKKRVLKEYDENIKKANEELITQLITVLDAFDRALNIDNIENEQLKTFHQGTELINKQIKDILKEAHLQEINPKSGDHFDPNVHEAVMAENLDDNKDHIIVKVFEKGYCLSNKLIRAAKVKVGNAD